MVFVWEKVIKACLFLNMKCCLFFQSKQKKEKNQSLYLLGHLIICNSDISAVYTSFFYFVNIFTTVNNTPLLLSEGV
jgi:hypothetical protein